MPLGTIFRTALKFYTLAFALQDFNEEKCSNINNISKTLYLKIVDESKITFGRLGKREKINLYCPLGLLDPVL